jgi:hypothetical protein
MNILAFLLLAIALGFSSVASADSLPQRVLIVLTNTATVPCSDRPTGVWASEYTDPYRVFTQAGFEVHVASPQGGQSPVDPRSGSEEQVQRISSAWEKMQDTRPLTRYGCRIMPRFFLRAGTGRCGIFPIIPCWDAWWVKPWPRIGWWAPYATGRRDCSAPGRPMAHRYWLAGG